MPNAKEQQAIELKYEGVTYQEISKKIDQPFPTIRDWFMTKGKLKEAYDEYEREQNNFRVEEAKKIIRKNIANAAKVVVNSLAAQEPSVKLKAALEMLDREMGKAKETVEQIDKIKVEWEEIPAKQPSD